jgi:hypothetical protein
MIAWEVISAYSRKQAIEDGCLVDLREGFLPPRRDGKTEAFDNLVSQAGIRLPIACTRAVWNECIDMTPAAERACNDIGGRLWDVLFMASRAMRRAAAYRDTDRVKFSLYVVRDRQKATFTKLRIVCGPGDDAEPVLTITFPHED